MGFASGTVAFDRITEYVLNLNISEKEKVTFITDVIDTFEDMDWDCHAESYYYDHPIVVKALTFLHPDWFDSDEEQPVKEFTTIKDVQQYGMENRIRLARKNVSTRVIPMDEDFICHTPEGTVQGSAGGYLAIGAKDECYPIGKDYFEASYEFV